MNDQFDACLQYPTILEAETPNLNRARQLSNCAERLFVERQFIERVARETPDLRAQLSPLLQNLEDWQEKLNKLVADHLAEASTEEISAEILIEEEVHPLDDLVDQFKETRDLLLVANQIEDQHLLSFFGAEEHGRWTGPSPLAAIKLPLEKLVRAGARTLSVTFLNHLADNIPEETKFGFGEPFKFFDPISINWENQPPNVYTAKLTLPPEVTGYFWLVRHATKQQEPDPRYLGVYVSSIRVTAE